MRDNFSTQTLVLVSYVRRATLLTNQELVRTVQHINISYRVDNVCIVMRVQVFIWLMMNAIIVGWKVVQTVLVMFAQNVMKY